MMAVDVMAGPTLKVGAPKASFEWQNTNIIPVTGHDVTSDGQRFLMVQNDGQSSGPATTQMTVVLNWFEELKRLMPNN